VAHGGWTAASFDEVLGHLVLLHGGMAVTGQLTIEFLRPVPIERDLEIRAWIEGSEGHRLQIRGELTLAGSGAVLGRAHGTFVQRDNPAAHFDKLDHWLAEQDRIAAKGGTD